MSDSDSAQRSEPVITTLLRVFVHAIAGAVIAWPLTVTAGVFAAACGGAIGSLLARFVARTPMRLPALFALFVVALFGVLLLRLSTVEFALAPEIFGPSGALVLGDVIVFGLGALVVSLALRTLSIRYSAWTILETGLVAAGFASLVVAHRNGAIHRPYEIADWMIARGDDPTLAILVIGGCGALVIGLLLLSERSLLRSIFHLGAVALLLLLIVGTTTMVDLPTPPSSGGALGLQDDDEEARERRQQGRGQGQGQQGRRESDELEFLDDYPSGGGAPDAVVLFHDDYSSPSGYYYFRQNAFSQYNGRKLVAATLSGVDADVRNVFPTNRSREPQWVPDAGQDRTTVETTVALLADNSAPLALEAPSRFVPATNPNPQRFRRLYRVHSVSLTTDPIVLIGRRGGDASWSEQTRAHYTRGPDDPRYATLARQIVDALPEHLRDDPMAKALAITQYLGEHGTYSLRSRHAGAEDPTAHFLFGDLTGYCVHFAHAGVYLMRAVGVPARVGTGYAVAEANREGGSALLLRNSDQHAWPEVFVEGAGWVVADVAPENVLDPPGEPPDPQLQRLLGEMARGSDPLADAPQPPRPMAEVVRDLRAPAVIALLGMLAIALFTLYSIKWWRLLAPRFGPRPRWIYRAALDRLSADGVRRGWGESPEAFARRVADRVPTLRTLTDGHLGAAFGRLDAASVANTMRPQLANLDRERAAAVPVWRRTLGALNPFSWLFTR